MGLDAAVYCNCWRDGKTTEPPIPREWVNVDEDGWVWNSNPRWSSGLRPGCEAYDRAIEIDVLFDTWQRSEACQHEDMCLAKVWVSNWAGVSGFRQALRMAGEDRFQTVLAELPMGNGGTVPPETAARMLDELDAFLALDGYGSLAVLLDEDTGEEVWRVAEGHRSLFQGSGKEQLTFNVDQHGFVIIGKKKVREVRPFGPIKLALNRTVRDEVFRSLRFTHQPTDVGVEYRDVETGTVFISQMPIGDQDQPRVRRFRVGFKQQDPADYTHEVEALTTVCRTSVESGNPVAWL
ncbi:hypothetical protein D3C72_645390 [compost metagenome]